MDIDKGGDTKKEIAEAKKSASEKMDKNKVFYLDQKREEEKLAEEKTDAERRKKEMKRAAASLKKEGVSESAHMAAVSDLRNFIDRVERLETEGKELKADIKAIYAEAESKGYDAKTMKLIIRERKKEAQDRRHEREMYELYAEQLEMEI